MGCCCSCFYSVPFIADFSMAILMLSVDTTTDNMLMSSMCSLPFITATADGPKHIDTTLTRAKFEELCSDLLDRYMTFCQSHELDKWVSWYLISTGMICIMN